MGRLRRINVKKKKHVRRGTPKTEPTTLGFTGVTHFNKK